MKGRQALPSYVEFTVDKYNSTIKALVKSSLVEVTLVFLASIIALFAPIRGELGSPLRYIWLLFMPLVMLGIAGKARLPFTFKGIDVEKLSNTKLEDVVVHAIVTSGTNIGAVENTVESIQYWYREVSRKYNINVRYEVEVITEEYALQRLKRALPSGVRLIAVPQGFRTKNGASYKARALEYARINRQLGNAARTWIYHHDDETAVGEDTILGIIGFIINKKGDVGVNAVVYPLAWKGGIVGHLETVRSALDVTNISISPKILKHGSGFITKALVEDSIGWDFKEALAEDFIFHSRASKIAKYGVLEGFAYELSPPTLADMLKQRRRWFVGKLDAYLNGSVDIGSSVKELMDLMENVAYLPINIVAAVIGAHYLGVMEPPALLAISIVSGYYLFIVIKDSFMIHMRYVGFEPIDFIPHVFYAGIGMLVESLAPWYAFISRDNGYFVMEKRIQLQLGFRY